MAVRLIPKGDQMVPQGPESGQRKTYSITVEGRERKFHVFLPSAYDGSRRLPLLLSLHGNSGYQPERESWFYAAEREGFVVVYPEAVKEEKWNIWGLKTKSGGPDDIAYLDAVLDDMIENFAVDPDRIYMHGQSMGDNMASYYAYHRSERLAALTVTSGPVLPSVMYDQEGNLQFGPKKPLPAARTHGEKDYMCGLPSTYGISKEVIAQALTVQEQVELRHTMDSLQKEVWKTVNQTAKKPLLYFDEEKNVEIYPGKEADFLFYSIVGGVHRPALNVFDMLWQGGAKGYYRSGTQRGRDEGCPGVKPDEKAMAFAQGSDCFYSGLQVRSLKEEGISAEILENQLYLSAKSIPKLFPDFDLELRDDGCSAVFHYQGHEIQCAQGRELFLIDGWAKPAPAPIKSGENLMISVTHLLPLMGAYYVACRDGAAYASTHPAAMTQDGAYAILEMLDVRALPSPKEALAQEAAIRGKIETYIRNMKQPE